MTESTFDINSVAKDLLACRIPKKGSNIITPICRLSFPHLFHPKAMKDAKPDDKKKYSCSLLVPPQCDLTKLKDMASEAAREKWGEKVTTMKLKTPFLQAGEFEYEGYINGWTLLRLSAINKPSVVHQKGADIIKLTEEDESEAYPGRWCIASLNAFAYEQKGNKGVAFGLNNIFLLNHDNSLGGKMKAEDEFEAIGDYTGGGAATGSIDSLF